MGPVLWLISLCIIKLMGQERKWSLAHTQRESHTHTWVLWLRCGHIVTSLERRLCALLNANYSSNNIFVAPSSITNVTKRMRGTEAKKEGARSRQKQRKWERRRGTEGKNLALYTTYSKANNSTVPPPSLPHGQLCAANDVTEYSERFYIHPPTSKLLVIN